MRREEGGRLFLVARQAQAHEKEFKMKRLLIGACVLAALLVAYVAGLELGHRWGYDEGWRDCKFDAKETLGLEGNDSFWRWYDSKKSRIRKRQSIFE